MDDRTFLEAVTYLLSPQNIKSVSKSLNAFMIARHETTSLEPPRARGFNSLSVSFDLTDLSTLSRRPYGTDVVSLTLLLRKRHFRQLMLSASSSPSKLLGYTVANLSDDSLGPITSIQPRNPGLLCDFFKLMAVVSFERQEGWDVALESLAVALLASVLSEDSEMRQRPSPDTVVGLVIQEISAHPESASLATLAAKYSYNPSYLSTLLREKSGKTFSELVLEQRMARARTLLENSSLPVASIASLVGYSGTTNFYRKFSECYGMTPSELRAAHETA